MKNQMFNNSEFSPETVQLLKELNINTRVTQGVANCDTLIDDEWLNEFVEEYNF